MLTVGILVGRNPDAPPRPGIPGVDVPRPAPRALRDAPRPLASELIEPPKVDKGASRRGTRVLEWIDVGIRVACSSWALRVLSQWRLGSSSSECLMIPRIGGLGQLKVAASGWRRVAAAVMRWHDAYCPCGPWRGRERHHS